MQTLTNFIFIQKKLMKLSNKERFHSLTKIFYAKLNFVFILFFGMIISQFSTAQSSTPTTEPCNQGCTAKDLKLKRAYLVSKNQQGQVIPLQGCLSGNTVTVYLAVELQTSTPRKGLSAFTNIQETPVGGGSPTYQVLAECFPEQSLATSGDVTTIIFTNPLTWTCGSAVELKETRVSWGTGNTDFCGGSTIDKCGATSSKCWKQGPQEVIIVETFPCTPATLGGISNDTKCAGTSKTFSTTFSAAANTTITSVEWQVSSNSGSSWTKLTTGGVYTVDDNTTSPAELTISNVTGLTGNQYRCVVYSYSSSSQQSCSTSTTATLTVDPASNGGSAAAANSPICTGSGTSISLTGNTGNIQKWQYSTNGTDWTDIASTANPLSTGNLSTTTQFLAVVKSGVCDAANSTPATVNVDPASVGGTATAANSPICAGTGTTISLSGATGVLQKWQYATNGSWTDINSTDNPLNTGNLSVTTKYQAVVKSGVCDAVNSNEVTVTVNAKPANPSASITATPTCSSASGTVTVNSPLDANSIDYEYKLNNGNWTDDVIFSVNAGDNYTIYVRNKAGQCEADGQATGTMDAQPDPVPAAKALITQDVSCSSSTGKVRIVQDPSNQAYDPAVYEFSNDGTTYGVSDEFTFSAGGGYDLYVRRKADITCVTSVGCESENQAASVNRNTQNDLQENRTITQHIEMPGSDATIKAFPNPFNDRVRFVVSTPEAGTGSLEVHNMLGQKVKTVFQGRFNAGTQSFEMQVPNNQQSTLIYVLRINGKQVSGKMLQVKE